MSIQLTRRQQEFLNQFLDVFRDSEEPVHYVSLAKQMGIGKVTAYEMLRLLEERGLLQSEYRLPEEDRGPGRSTVFFVPTPVAYRVADNPTRTADQEAWEYAKLYILEQLQEGKEIGYHTFLEELVSRIPERRSVLIYLTEMVTATMLSLEGLREKVGTDDLIKRLQRIGLPDEINLNSLPGVSVSLSMVRQINKKTARFLLEQSGKFQTQLAHLGEENRNRLSDFAREVARILSD